MAVDLHIRVALFDAYNERCRWCDRPLVFADMQVDHVIPQSCEPDELAELVEMHRLDADFDVYATYNLVPSCGSDNRCKSDRPLPDTPIISLLLDQAREKAPAIESRADGLKSNNKLAKHAAILIGHPGLAEADESLKKQLLDAMSGFAFAYASETGERLQAERVHAMGSCHDYVAPSIVDASAEQDFYENDMFALIQDWMDRNSGEAKDLVADAFDHDHGRILNAGIRDVTRLGYASQLDSYLARLDVPIEYLYVPDDNEPAPVDDQIVIDVWVELDDERENVETIVVDFWNSFGD